MSAGKSATSPTGSAINTVNQDQANQFGQSIAQPGPQMGFGEDFNLPGGVQMNMPMETQPVGTQPNPVTLPGGPQLGFGEAFNLPGYVGPSIGTQPNPNPQPMILPDGQQINLVGQPSVAQPGPQLGFGEDFNMPIPVAGPAQQPIVQQPITVAPVQQPIVQQPIVQQPIVQQPVVQQPMVQQPIARPVSQPIVRQPTAALATTTRNPQQNPFAKYTVPTAAIRQPSPVIRPVQMPTRATQGYQSRLPQRPANPIQPRTILPKYK